MKEKRVFVLILILTVLLTASFCYASEATENAAVDKGYSCLKASLGDNCGGTKNTALNAFNLLAMAHDSDAQTKCKNELISKKSIGDCWGTSESLDCNLKSTSLAIIALSRVDSDVDAPVKWLLDKKRSKTGLTWFLEIDTENVSECTINGQYKIKINEDKKIVPQGGSYSALSMAYNNYWFKINDVELNYSVTCDKTFTTTLLYQKPSSGVFYVSSNPHSASAGDSTTEKVESYCFGVLSDCDYEGSLWATVALLKHGEDTAPYLPYLMAFADEPANKKYLPSAFLLMFTGMSEYEEELLSLQQQGKYWGDQTTKLDLTPLALLALSGNVKDEVKSSLSYILSLQDQSTGCWSDDKTSWILYAIWPKNPTSTGPVDTGTSVVTCTDKGFFCVASLKCELNDQVSGGYECSGFGDVCCSKDVQEQTCDEKFGVVCADGEVCSESTVTASDTPNCCLQSCVEATPVENSCTSKNFICRASCTSSEEPKSGYSADCGPGEICCGKKATEPASKSNWLLIVLLIVLIILIILAILFRNQLKVWWFKIKSGFSSKKGPPPTNRPTSNQPYRPVPPRPMVGQRPMQRIMGRPPVARPSEKDKDFEDTMKKLRDMSK